MDHGLFDLSSCARIDFGNQIQIGILQKAVSNQIIILRNNFELNFVTVKLISNHNYSNNYFSNQSMAF